MKHPRFPLFFALWVALAVALPPVLRAQGPEAPPSPAAPAGPTDPAGKVDKPEDAVPAPLEETKPAAAAGDADVQKSEEARRSGEAAKPDEAEPEQPDLARSDAEKTSPKARTYRRARSSDVPPIGDQRVASDIRQSEAVSIFGNTTIDGHVTREAVSIMGDLTINGRVDGEAVSVLGSTTVNGSVGGEVVAVLGDVILGPDAEIGGDVVTVLGRVVRGEGARIHGQVTQISGGDFGDFGWLHAYIHKCLKWGRPLWFGEDLGWLWVVAGAFLVFYMLLALIFPRGIERCAMVLEERPGSTILATVLTALVTPVLTILLVMTGVGVILIPFLVAGLFFATLFGKAAVLAWFGRRITAHFGPGPMKHAVAAVFFGGFIVAALYLIPFLGFLLQKLFGVLGLGMVVYALVLASRREKPATAAVAAAVAPPIAAVAAVPAPVAPLAVVAPLAPGVAGTVEELPPPVVPVSPRVPPVVISAATLPRVGFWLRLAAGLLDFLLVAIAMAMIDEVLWFRIDGPGLIFLGLATYSAILWKARGTTIGGIICGLKVVRTDDRPIDWTIAIVRVLSAFLSFAVAGLGFIWVAFDDEKQSWHDKVAGTTVVKVPKGVSLL